MAIKLYAIVHDHRAVGYVSFPEHVDADRLDRVAVRGVLDEDLELLPVSEDFAHVPDGPGLVERLRHVLQTFNRDPRQGRR